jgi:hypothetical protein
MYSMKEAASVDLVEKVYYLIAFYENPLYCFTNLSDYTERGSITIL